MEGMLAVDPAVRMSIGDVLATLASAFLTQSVPPDTVEAICNGDGVHSSVGHY